MIEQNQRVLARKGARLVTEAEMEVICGVGDAMTNFIIFTHQSTNMGKDITPDEIFG